MAIALCALTAFGAADAATVRPVALVGERAPGTPEGTVFSRFGALSTINDAGEVAFAARLRGPSVTRANDIAIFTTSGLLAREGDAVPGAGGGVTLGDVGPRIRRDQPSPTGRVSLNEAGQMAYRANLVGPEGASAGEGLFVSSNLRVRSGDQAPGLRPGETFDNFGDPSINEGGEIAFTGQAFGRRVDSTNDRDIFHRDPAGGA